MKGKVRKVRCPCCAGTVGVKALLERAGPLDSSLMNACWLTGIRGVFGWCFALGLACCNPFAAFAECDNAPARNVAPGEVAEGVDVYASVAVAFNEYHGDLVWSEPGDRSKLVVTTEPGPTPAVTTSDCDGAFDGFVVPAQATLVSDDGFVNLVRPFWMHLNRDGEISPIENVVVDAYLDFEALKAAGETQKGWVSGFEPRLKLTLVAPEMKPQNGEVLVEEQLGQPKSHFVSIGSITFP